MRTRHRLTIRVDRTSSAVLRRHSGEFFGCVNLAPWRGRGPGEWQMTQLYRSGERAAYYTFETVTRPLPHGTTAVVYQEMDWDPDVGRGEVTLSEGWDDLSDEPPGTPEGEPSGDESTPDESTPEDDVDGTGDGLDDGTQEFGGEGPG